jgi:hypothetical protein
MYILYVHTHEMNSDYKVLVATLPFNLLCDCTQASKNTRLQEGKLNGQIVEYTKYWSKPKW